MKASEIVDKLKSVLLSAEDTVVEQAEEQVELSAEEVEVNEPVELGYEDKEGMEEDMPVEDEVKVEYVSKDDFERAIAEVKAMYDALVEKMGSEEMEVEVPTEDLAKEELSAQEPAVEPITHAPQAESQPKKQLFNGLRPKNTMSVVYEKMFNN